MSSRFIVDQQGFLDITELNVTVEPEYIFIDSDLNCKEEETSRACGKSEGQKMSPEVY